jgi:hypothetical protein
MNLVLEYTAKSMSLNRMMGAAIADESNIYSCAESDLRKKYRVSDALMRELKEEASGLNDLAKRVAGGLA